MSAVERSKIALLYHLIGYPRDGRGGAVDAGRDRRPREDHVVDEHVDAERSARLGIERTDEELRALTRREVVRRGGQVVRAFHQVGAARSRCLAGRRAARFRRTGEPRIVQFEEERNRDAGVWTGRRDDVGLLIGEIQARIGSAFVDEHRKLRAGRNRDRLTDAVRAAGSGLTAARDREHGLCGRSGVGQRCKLAGQDARRGRRRRSTRDLERWARCGHDNRTNVHRRNRRERRGRRHCGRDRTGMRNAACRPSRSSAEGAALKAAVVEDIGWSRRGEPA